MSSAMSLTTDDSGNEFSPTDFADLRLLISENPNNTDLIGEADGGSFETYVLSGDEPDGDYYVVAASSLWQYRLCRDHRAYVQSYKADCLRQTV